MSKISKNKITSRIKNPDVNSPEDGEEIEITAQVNIPQEGGWGWVVVACSFFVLLILDGIVFTFGSLLSAISEDFDTPDVLTTLSNSVAVATYYCVSPLCSGLINRFGFRACVMSGSVVTSFSLLIASFCQQFGSFCIFYGLFAGLGYSLVNMSACLIVGFYFERLRSVAIAISLCGSSLGIMIMPPLNTVLISLVHWRFVILIQSGLFGLIYFLGMSFKPILSLAVVSDLSDSTRTVTYLRSVSTVRGSPSSVKANKTERLFSAVSNSNFPTAATIVKETPDTNQAGPSTKTPTSTLKLATYGHGPESAISQRQLNQVRSMMTKSSMESTRQTIEVEGIVSDRSSTTGCCGMCCRWEKHVRQARPLYRDDVFYDGKMSRLDIYKKSVVELPKENRTGLEYQLAVQRTAAASDLQEQRGVFTTSIRRVLATMMDPSLLKKRSFIFLCFSGFATYLGFLVPFVFLPAATHLAGIPAEHCALFISVLGLSNAFGRFIIGLLAIKLNPITLYFVFLIIGGLSTMVCNLSHTIYYQYAYCTVYGFCLAGISTLRSMVIVSLYGLDKLTNATGIILLFQGIGGLLGTPIAGGIKMLYGFDLVFYVSGALVAFSGIMVIPIECIAKKESGKTDKKENKPKDKKENKPKEKKEHKPKEKKEHKPKDEKENKKDKKTKEVVDKLGT